MDASNAGEGKGREGEGRGEGRGKEGRGRGRGKRRVGCIPVKFNLGIHHCIFGIIIIMERT